MTAAAVVPFAAGREGASTHPMSRSSFSPFVDSTFHLSDGGRAVPVVLSRIDDITSTTPATREDRFSLVFKGRAHDRTLSQDTRRLVHAGRPAVDLFIVPVGHRGHRGHRGNSGHSRQSANSDNGGSGQTYEAIIHRRA